MLDQLIIGEKLSYDEIYKASYDDFDASLKERVIKPPAKKEIKETVPFSNKAYDFSKINGELYWEERELTYVFEIIEDSPEDLEHAKSKFSNWIMNVFNEQIHDPFEPEYHYIGTFYDMEYEDDDCMEKTTATVTFKAYPYKIANTATTYTVNLKSGETKTINARNDSGHKIIPVVWSTTTITDQLIPFVITTRDGLNNATEHNFPAGKISDSHFTLAMGNNILEVENIHGFDTIATISFYREVL